MRLLGWIVLALCAAVLFHARLAAWPVAPDLPLALAAWALVCGDERLWMLRVWLLGVVRDLIDPGSDWFHAAAHVLLLALCLPLRRWIPVHTQLALALVGAGMSLTVQAIDAVASGPGGWTWWNGGMDALLTAAAAMAVGWLAPRPAPRTVAIEEQPPAAEGAEAGAATP